MGKLVLTDVVEKAEQSFSNLENMEMEIRTKHMSPPGELGLPPLLESKRWKENIPDMVFKRGAAVYDRVLIAQTSDVSEVTKGGIVKPMVTLMRENQQSARGVIISAGLQALDALKSNGMDIGHTVHVARMSTYSLPVGEVMGKEIRVLLVHAGEICVSEDLLLALQKGECKVDAREVEQGGVKQLEHYYVDATGNVWNPVSPNFTEDY